MIPKTGNVRPLNRALTRWYFNWQIYLFLSSWALNIANYAKTNSGFYGEVIAAKENLNKFTQLICQIGKEKKSRRISHHA